MEKMVQRILRIASCALMTGILLLSEAGTAAAYAANTGVLGLDKSESVTFDMDFEFVDKDVETPIGGAEFTIWQVAGITDDGRYELLPSFAGVSADFTPDLESSSQMLKMAKACKQVTDQQGMSGTRAVTDAGGKVSFGTIPPEQYGVFLVAQTGRTGSAVDYKYIDPFLITLPDRGKDGEWTYHVKSSPKTTLQKEAPPKGPTITPPPKKPSPPPKKYEPGKPTGRVKTGDIQSFWLWVWLAGASLLVAVGVLAFKRKQ